MADSYFKKPTGTALSLQFLKSIAFPELGRPKELCCYYSAAKVLALFSNQPGLTLDGLAATTYSDFKFHYSEQVSQFDIFYYSFEATEYIISLVLSF